MDKLDRIASRAAPLPEADIDTDAIFPARFLLVIEREKYRDYLFADRRKSGDFVLDHPLYRGTQIIVTGPRFGIGSSREHAVWALADFGIRCIIAPSFGDILRANCFKNGVLPIALAGQEHAAVMAAAQAGEEIVVDLVASEIRLTSKPPIAFAVDPEQRAALLEGQDHIDRILADEQAIAAFEQAQRAAQPWLWLDLAKMQALAATRLPRAAADRSRS